MQIAVTPTLSELARSLAAQRGCSISGLLRDLLAEHDGSPLPGGERKTEYLAVRLNADEQGKLDRLARQSKLPKSEAMTRLLESAIGPAPTPVPEPQPAPVPERPSIPRRNAWRKWAELVLRAAESTPDRYRLGENKVFLAAALDRLALQLDPLDPTRIIGLARELLPELNRRDLVRLGRCDLPQLAPDLAQRSALSGPAGALWHCIELERHL